MLRWSHDIFPKTTLFYSWQLQNDTSRMARFAVFMAQEKEKKEPACTDS